MPEEINRIVADHASRLRFCPDRQSVENLAAENITAGVIQTGDLMLDAFALFAPVAKRRKTFVRDLGLNRVQAFALLTMHRPSNTDCLQALERCIDALAGSPLPFVFVVHPRTQAAFERHGLWAKLQGLTNIHVKPALGYIDMLTLLLAAEIVVTDSGGLQKEAYFAAKPCLLLQHSTPWPNIRDAGWQRIMHEVGSLDLPQFHSALASFRPTGIRPPFFGEGNAARVVVEALETHGYV